MNKRRFYGKKIKKTRNLYRKKKTAGQKVFGTVMLILAASALVFLGFCIGKPLFDYIGSIGSDEPEQWSPAASYSSSAEEQPQESTAVSPENPAPETSLSAEQTPAVGTNQPHSTTASSAESSVPELTPVSSDAIVATELPFGALANRAALSSALAKAKAGGFNAASMLLKDGNGYFRYKTQTEGTQDLVTGTMTLDEIISVFTENNMIPVAEISVLSDAKGCELFTDMSYKCLDAPTVSWLDYTLSPPRRWANPESTATLEYFAKVTAELNHAGFEKIILKDIIFPDFQHYDTPYIAAKYFAEDRYKYLYNVVKAGTVIEMKASDVIGDELGRSAEVLKDISQLRGNSIGLVISRSDLPADEGNPADAKTFVETVLFLAKKKTGSLPVIPIIDSAGFDDAERSGISALLGSLDMESYIMR